MSRDGVPDPRRDGAPPAGAAPRARVSAVISDFGGVLTTPLVAAFAEYSEHSGISGADFGRAMARAAQFSGGEPPIYTLERGELSEREFLTRLEDALDDLLGRRVDLAQMGERLMGALRPNEELFAYYRRLRDERGIRLAILTNNVREWESRWRPMLPIDEIFDDVVDSAFVGMRKPEPAIYRLALERLGVTAQACAFVDDMAVNVEAARALGMHGVLFRETAQAIAELDELLG